MRANVIKQDFFYDKVSEERAKDLKDKVLTLMRENYAERKKDKPMTNDFHKKFQ